MTHTHYHTHYHTDREVSPFLKLNAALYENPQDAARALFEKEHKSFKTSTSAAPQTEGSSRGGRLQETDETKEEEEMLHYRVPEHCIPIRADVRYFDWQALANVVQFDVIMMDPPWQLASAKPTRGVTIGYKQLNDRHIEEMKIDLLQRNGGFLFIWVINAKYAKTLQTIRRWGYRFVDDIAWVKSTNRRRMAKGHGHYLQHAKEHCLVAIKGQPSYNRNVQLSDVIFAERRGQSQKPEQLYEHIEQLVPNGRYLEIFARKNNLRNFWMSIGIEL